MRHIVCHNISIRLDGNKSVCPSEEQSFGPRVFIESSITEFSDFQSVFPVVSLPGIGFRIEPYQSLICADPKVILLVFQNAMYCVVCEKVSPVMIM